MHELLQPRGKLIGLWFNFPEDSERQGPPYTGTKEEYNQYFSTFSKVLFENAHNSIKPRSGRELFGIINK